MASKGLIRSLASQRVKPFRYSVSISAWFKNEDFGMDEYEILSRASAFCTRRLSDFFPQRLHFLTAAHVTSPWRYPRYYQEEWDWLQHINETHTKYTVEIRELDTGNILLQYPLLPRVFVHPTRDIAVVHLETEELSMKDMRSRECALEPLIFDVDVVARGETIFFLGHEIAEPPEATDPMGNDDRVQIPKYFEGRLTHFDKNMLYGATSKPLEWGMCGGPVFRFDGTCMGIIEGTVKPNPTASPAFQLLAHNAACIRSVELLSLLDLTERHFLGGNVTDTRPQTVTVSP